MSVPPQPPPTASLRPVWPRRRLAELAAALAFHTRLPVPVPALEHGAFACAVWAHPLAGTLVGALGAATLLAAAGLPPLAGAALALLATALLTGGLHEDGLADCGDGLLPAGRDAGRRLAAMTDARIGAHGALVLLLVKLSQATALAALPADTAAALLLCAHMAARALPALLLQTLPPAKRDGLAASFGRPGWTATAVALGLGATALAGFIAVTGQGPWTAAVFAAAWLVPALTLALAARRQLGGVTGDVCGGAEQVAEASLALAAAALLAA